MCLILNLSQLVVCQSILNLHHPIIDMFNYPDLCQSTPRISILRPDLGQRFDKIQSKGCFTGFQPLWT